MAVELRHLRSFLTIAEEGNIGRAAARLYITQPAMSRQIQHLERELGVTILIRAAHGVELTDAGRELVDKARIAIEAVDEALAVGHAGQPRGKLVLGHPLAGGRQRWFDLTQAFANRYPAVEVEISEAISGHLQRQVLARELDGAFVLAPDRLAGLTYTHVIDDVIDVWLHRDHKLAARSQLTLEDLDGENVLLLGGAAARGSGFNAAIRGLFADTAIRPRFSETLEIYPPRAALTSEYLSITVAVDFPDGVLRVPLVPRRTLEFLFVQRVENNRATVRAYRDFVVDLCA